MYSLMHSVRLFIVTRPCLIIDVFTDHSTNNHTFYLDNTYFRSTEVWPYYCCPQQSLYQLYLNEQKQSSFIPIYLKGVLYHVHAVSQIQVLIIAG